MENLWAPWRMTYMRQLGQSPPDGGSCFLCDAAAVEVGSPEARRCLVLKRDERGVLLLNRYPYTNGHLLAASLDHVGDLESLSAEGRAGLMELAVVAQRILGLAVSPQGFNIGFNLGRCAGAGLPGHVHLHIVPRWNGDTNFMPLFGEVRVIPQALEESHRNLSEALARLDPS